MKIIKNGGENDIEGDNMTTMCAFNVLTPSRFPKKEKHFCIIIFLITFRRRKAIPSMVSVAFSMANGLICNLWILPRHVSHICVSFIAATRVVPHPACYSSKWKLSFQFFPFGIFPFFPANFFNLPWSQGSVALFFTQEFSEAFCGFVVCHSNLFFFFSFRMEIRVEGKLDM